MAQVKFETENLNWDKVDGLMPAIVQDSATKTVLMLGYMNRDALSTTLDTGLVTFFSRTRNELWQKGEVSGNTLALKSIKTDCDSDTLLVSAAPNGPTCHKGFDTCFEEENTGSTHSTQWLGTLEDIIKSRASASVEESYTAKLMERGVKRIAQKVGEEGVEVALAAATDDTDELIEESADLLYHLTLLLVAKDKSLDDVVKCLQARHNK